jgi:hypothetical protein
LFLHLKSFLAGRRFHDDNEVKEAVTTCFASQTASFYHEGTQKLVQRYDKCLTMVETMSKGSVRYVHQMAIYRVCNIFLFFFLNSPSELTFWITLVIIIISVLPVQEKSVMWIIESDAFHRVKEFGLRGRYTV